MKDYSDKLDRRMMMGSDKKTSPKDRALHNKAVEKQSRKQQREVLPKQRMPLTEAQESGLKSRAIEKKKK